MTAQERIAKHMYNVHVNWYNSTRKDSSRRKHLPEKPEWEDLDISVRAYWFSLSECCLEIMMEPDPDMMAAVITEMKRPVKVTGLSWVEQREIDFLRFNAAALRAARADLTELIEKLP